MDAATQAQPTQAPTELIGWWRLAPSISGDRHSTWELIVSFSTGGFDAPAQDGRGPSPERGSEKTSHGPVRLNAAIWSLGSEAYRRPVEAGIAAARRAIESYGWQLGEEIASDPRRKAAQGTIRAPKAES